MPWVRFDDQFPIHRKVRGLSDPAYRLCSEAIFWCARNGTDELPEAELRSITHLRRPRKHVLVLVERELWTPTAGGWRIPQSDGVHSFWSIERDDYRRKIPQWIRELVYERDEYRCVECAATEDLTLDHIYPWSLGGSDDPHNLRTLCRPCNSSKGARVQ